MTEPGKLSWEQGRADALREAPANCPEGLDELAYLSGYFSGKVQREKQLKSSRGRPDWRWCGDSVLSASIR
jgi:hypothetical protein